MDAREIITYIRDAEKKTPVKMYVKERVPVDYGSAQVFGAGDKILTFLSMEARRQGSATFVLPLNRTEMAEYLCINRSAMTRELSALKKEGLIDIDRDRFTLYSADFGAEPM